MKYTFLFIFILVFTFVSKIQAQKTQRPYRAIYSGAPWFDNRDSILSAHGANIIKDDDVYYLFGEVHSDTSNAFAGFNCYASTDLYNWAFKSAALRPQKTGKLGPNRVGERPKVMRCPATGKYVMYMHVDSLNYKDQFVGYATADKITGPYDFKGPLFFGGKPIRKWDMGTFQDTDGSGYILIHGGHIYKLSDDYTSVVAHVNKSMTSGFESPALFKKDSIYFFLGSNLTSWEKNDNYYFTAKSLSGPWTKQGLFAPKNTLTWNSQTTFVFQVNGSEDTAFIYMGDRWSYPKQASAATYVWQPMAVHGTKISIPELQQGWTVNLRTGQVGHLSPNNQRISNQSRRILYKGNWHQDTTGGMCSDQQGDSFQIQFTGTRIAWSGHSSRKGGYAKTVIHDKNGSILYSAIIDLYCLYPDKAIKFISPGMPKDTYHLTVTVLGVHPSWSDKRRSDYGSTGNFVSLDDLSVTP